MLKTAPPEVNRLRVAVVGTGISGLSAAWLLDRAHDVTVFEADGRIGGHSNSVSVASAAGPIAVDTGFIVFNEVTYPNLTALFAHLGVATKPSDMSFAVSLDQGKLEYAGTDLFGMFVQKRNLLRPRFYAMIRDLLHFYRHAPANASKLGLISLDAYLDQNGYGRAFREDHLYPMAAAIWSTPAGRVGAYPAASFIRFCENHGLLKITNRPIWRTVAGGSRAYVERLTSGFGDRIRRGCGIRSIVRREGAVDLIDAAGGVHTFDRVLLACHADQALRLLERPSGHEAATLGAFAYSRNEAILHTDPALMPRRRKAWCSWNYLADSQRRDSLSVTYWMNRLQGLVTDSPLFVTLNPAVAPRADLVHYSTTYEHPTFDEAAISAQQRLWSLQGAGGVWFAGAYFGSGFHEDGLQAGLAAAEHLGDVRRPWNVPDESGRIVLDGQIAGVGEQLWAA